LFYEPKKGYPFDENPFAALVFPRPIGWISTLSKNGIANLAPYSFFNAIAYEPPQVMFSATGFHSQGGLKDSIANVLSNNEFVVNLATKKLKTQVNQTSIDAPHGIDEFNVFKVLNQDGLRNEKEFVNHKILDCIGDLYLCGYKIIGKITCSQGGHKLTNQLLREVFQNQDNFSVIEIKEKTIPNLLINRKYLRSIA